MPFILFYLFCSLFYNPHDKDDNFKNKRMISVKMPFILSNLSSSLFYNPPDKVDNFKNKKMI